MIEDKKFQIIYDKERGGIEKTFQVKDGTLKHKTGVKFRALPFDTKEKNIIRDFLSVSGCFARIIAEQDLDEDFSAECIIERMEEKVEMEEADRKNFRDIIKSLYLTDGRLSIFNLKSMVYIKKQKSNEEKVAMFLFDVLMNDELKRKFQKLLEEQDSNLLNRLVFEAMPELKGKKYDIGKYGNFVPYVKEHFVKDLEYLLKQRNLNYKSLERLLEYYYMFYVTQLALKLNKFHNGQREQIEQLYYTLSWEITSQDRDAFKYGYQHLKSSVEELFSHAVTLELLNHNNLGRQMDYIDFYEYFIANESEGIEDEIEKLIQTYKENVPDGRWDSFHEEIRDRSGNEAFDKVRELYNMIVHQFQETTRKAPHDKYKNWIVFFVQERFGKSRGRNGFNFNLTEEDMILFTQIIVGVAGGRIRLKLLFEEMEHRGLFFDRESKKKIIELYERLNLIEKKSDSGDAQYVRANL